MKWTRWAAAALALLLAACGSSNRQESAAPPSTSATEATAKDATKNTAKDTVFKEMVGTMDEARAVEDTSKQHKEQLDQALEQAEGK